MLDIKDVKSKMLQSGVPLENTVLQEISQNGWMALPNIPIKISENESEIDVLARERIKKGSHNVCLDIPIQCKYRYRNVNWYFFGRKARIEAFMVFNGIFNKIKHLSLKLMTSIISWMNSSKILIQNLWQMAPFKYLAKKTKHSPNILYWMPLIKVF